jgi:hypothetical protein
MTERQPNQPRLERGVRRDGVEELPHESNHPNRRAVSPG